MKNDPENRENLDDSIQTAVVYQTFSVVLNLMNKTLLMLAERGADQRTLSFLVGNINSLIENINRYAGEITMEKNWNQDLDEICDRYSINRAGINPDELGGEEEN